MRCSVARRQCGHSRRRRKIPFVVPSPRQAPAAIAFFDELRRNGFIEGQNLAVVPDGFDADYGHLPELAAALVKAAPDAIIAGPARALQALQSVTHTIPLIGIRSCKLALNRNVLSFHVTKFAQPCYESIQNYAVWIGIF